MTVHIPADIVTQKQRLLEIRRHLHMHPELSNCETATQRFVLDTLRATGIDASPLGNTGAVATLQGKRPGKTLLLRADMDALPIDEEADVPFRSLTPGVMHACGHDTHTAMLLSTAKVLADRGLEYGTVRFLFQPAEEGGGGARSMIEAGVLKNPTPDGALALHVWSPWPTGTVAVIDGPTMAAVDGFEVTITGRGGHGALPESCIDPIAISATFITAAQQLISRRISAHQPAVLSFCSIRGGSAFNIIPEEVRILGTLRTFDESLRSRIRLELDALVRDLPASLGAKGHIEYFESHCATVNDVTMTELVRRAAGPIVGEHNISRPLPLMGGEDMGLILQQIPGAMIFVGCGPPDGTPAFPHHHPRFTVDEDALPIGVALLTAVTELFLSVNGGPDEI